MNAVACSIQSLLETLGPEMALEWRAGKAGAFAPLPPEHCSHGAALVNPLNPITPTGIQVIGPEEMAHLANLSPTERKQTLQGIFSQAVAVILSQGVEATAELLDAADENKTPLLAASLEPVQLLSHLRYHLNERLAERITVHGVCMEVLGTGILLTGESNVGKSELALELVTRGHRLIADDAPELARVTPGILQASCPPLLQDFLEVRGLGVLNIRFMYGDNAIKKKKNLRLVIELRTHASAETDASRLYGNNGSREILGITLPVIIIPVAPSRNLGVLVEAAVRKHQLHNSGYDAAKDLEQRQGNLLEGGQ